MRSIGGSLFLLAAFVGLLLLRSGVAEAKKANDDNPVRSFAKLKRGMSPEQVRQIVGPPKHIARQLLHRRYREQWGYDPPPLVRLTFDCSRGQLPELLSLPTFPNDSGARPNGK